MIWVGLGVMGASEMTFIFDFLIASDEQTSRAEGLDTEGGVIFPATGELEFGGATQQNFWGAIATKPP